MHKEKTLIKKTNIQKKAQNQNLTHPLVNKNQGNIKIKENINQPIKLAKKLTKANRPKTYKTQKHNQKLKKKKNWLK